MWGGTGLPNHNANVGKPEASFNNWPPSGRGTNNTDTKCLCCENIL